MSRPLRIEYPGAFYHVTSRGDRREDVFRENADGSCFLKVLADVCENRGWIVHSYCLMCNHYHLVVETPDPNLSTGMRDLNGIYTQKFNRAHGLVGHAFQGRFKAFLVDKDEYFLELCRYVVLNPVRAGMATGPEGWRWSSYGATAGLAPAPRFLDVAPTLAMFAPGASEAAPAYRKFVLDGVGLPSPLRDAAGGILGGDAFRESVARRRALPDPEAVREFVRRERYAERMPLARIFAGVSSRAERDRLIRLARRIDGYGAAEIARELGLHPSAVSRAMAGRD